MEASMIMLNSSNEKKDCIIFCFQASQNTSSVRVRVWGMQAFCPHWKSSYSELLWTAVVLSRLWRMILLFFFFLMNGNWWLWSNKPLKNCSLLFSTIVRYPDPGIQLLSVSVRNGPCSIHCSSGLLEIMHFTGLSVTLLADIVPVSKKDQEWQ